MIDIGARETDYLIADMERRIKQEYTQAMLETQTKLNDYMRRYRLKDKKWQEWVREGKKTKKEYEQWRVGQIAMGKRWEEMRDTLAHDLRNADNIARSITEGYLPDIYALNHDYSTFQIEKDSLIDTSYTLYRRETAEKILRDDLQMLPKPGKTVEREILEGKALRWNNQRIQSVMIQSLLQGESIPDIATRLARAVSDSNRKAAVRNARTMATGAQNAGRLDAMKRANAKGLNEKKQWLATLDGRTRHSHRVLDGQIRDVEKPFIVDKMKIMFPGDNSADPSLVYNCRCTLVAVHDVKSAKKEIRDMSLRRNDKLEGMSYDEWRESKKIKSNPILLPEKRAKAIRAKYIKQYREG